MYIYNKGKTSQCLVYSNSVYTRGLMGIFHPSVDWGQRAQASRHISIKNGNVSHANMGDGWHKGDRRCASMCKHANTGRPVPSVWLRFHKAEKLWNFYPVNLLLLIKVKRWAEMWVGGMGGWGEERRGGWVYCLDQPGQLPETLLTDLKSLLRSMSTGDVMCKAEMATLTHDRPLPVSCSHHNYCEHVMQKKILFACLKKPDSLYMVQVRSCYRTLVMTAASR